MLTLCPFFNNNSSTTSSSSSNFRLKLDLSVLWPKWLPPARQQECQVYGALESHYCFQVKFQPIALESLVHELRCLPLSLWPEDFPKFWDDRETCFLFQQIQRWLFQFHFFGLILFCYMTALCLTSANPPGAVAFPALSISDFSHLGFYEK